MGISAGRGFFGRGGRFGLDRADADAGGIALHGGRTDALDLDQIGRTAEGAIGFAVGHDGLGLGRADAVASATDARS